MMSKPRFVLISDVHASTSTLDLARKSLEKALDKAFELHVPLVVCGDLNDTKAIIRGEVANMLIKVFKQAKINGIDVYIIVGNHDRLNEKGKEHSLEFLRPYAKVIDEIFAYDKATYLLPYFNDSNELSVALQTIPKKSTIVMHQGFNGAHTGEYTVDKTSVSPSLVKDFTVFSGHYHMRQTVGTITYVGNPYTHSNAEANDPEKGFEILNTDGTLTHINTNLRKHIVVDRDIAEAYEPIESDPDDIVTIKLRGPYLELQKINKKELGLKLLGSTNFKLDKVPSDSAQITVGVKGGNEKIMDAIISNSSESAASKKQLKKLWRNLMS